MSPCSRRAEWKDLMGASNPGSPRPATSAQSADSFPFSLITFPAFFSSLVSQYAQSVWVPRGCQDEPPGYTRFFQGPGRKRAWRLTTCWLFFHQGLYSGLSPSCPLCKETYGKGKTPYTHYGIPDALVEFFGFIRTGIIKVNGVRLMAFAYSFHNTNILKYIGEIKDFGENIQILVEYLRSFSQLD